MWPFYVNYSEADSKKTLRSMELFAHSTVLETLRAQGHFNKEKKRILQDLCQILGVTPERHRAEIRRVCNDEHLNTIAEKVSGPNTVIGWATESRRLIPVMPRLGPQTVYTDIANTAARRQSAKNALVPGPKVTTEVVEKTEDPADIACTRKRKEDFHEYSIGVPRKILAMEHPSTVWSNPCLSNECYDGPSFPEVAAQDTPMVVEEPAMVSAGSFCHPQISPMMTSTPNPSPMKTPYKANPTMKPTSTVTTFSSFDQINTNLMSTPRCQFNYPKEEVEKPVYTDCSKRPLTTIGSVKSSTIVIPTSMSSQCMTSTNKDRPFSASTPTSSTKFISTTHVRSKTPRQNMPAGLGMKPLSNPPPMIPPKTPPVTSKPAPSPAKPQAVTSKSTMSAVMTTKASSCVKKTPDTTSSSSIFAKKSTPNLFIESNSNQPPQMAELKSKLNSVKCETGPKSMTPCKLRSDSPSPTILTQPPSLKMPKPAPKASVTSTTAQSYLTNRSLFSTKSSSAPVIFNVTSTTAVSEISSQMIMPKTTTVAAPNLAKLSATNSAQIQYRNDTGMVRSARIVNITQPGGTRLPCITPSAISALGLTTGISPIRVTVPAGSLHSNSLRVSGSAAKPNVIVVHKAQVWPRPSSAVIMSSTPISGAATNKVNNDSPVGIRKQQENNNHPHKQDKPAKQSPTVKPTTPSRTTVGVSPRPHSPAVVTTSAVKATPAVADSNNAIEVAESSQQKYGDKMTEAQCKMNLLADVIEASGILLDSNSPEKSSNREKSLRTKSDLSNHQEKDSTRGSSNKISSTVSSETNSTPKPEKNGVELVKHSFSHLKDLEVQIRDSSTTLSSALSSESLSSTDFDSKAKCS